MPISTFPRHDDYEDQFLLKPAGLRDTHSEGKVSFLPYYRIASSIRFDPKQTANWLRSQAA
jgi:hypothetical protein